MKRMISSGIGLKAWPWIRGIDQNVRRNVFPNEPVLGVARVIVRGTGTPASAVPFALFKRGETEANFNVYGGGADKSGLYIGCRAKPTKIYFTVKYDSWVRDNPQGYTALAVQGRLLPGQEVWTKGNDGLNLTWVRTAGIYHKIVANEQEAAVTELTPAVLAANGFTAYDPNGSGFVEFAQDATWDAWQPGYAGVIDPSVYTQFPDLPGDEDLWWVRVGDQCSMAWANGDLQHTSDRRTKVFNIRLEEEIPPLEPLATVPEGDNLIGAYDPANYVSGTTIQDDSGNGNTLTFNTAPTVDASAGTCFTGAWQASKTNEVLLYGTQNITMSLWVYMNGSRNTSICYNGNGGLGGFGLFQGNNNNGDVGNNLVILFGMIAFYKAVTGMTGLPRWQYITMRLNATGQANVRINGTTVYTGTARAREGISTFTWGGGTQSDNKFGSCAFWESYLSDAQVDANYNATKARYGL